MKILMLAPEPFFEPRGTPISVYFRIKALTELGHEVSLLTYHLGKEMKIPGLEIKRIPDLFLIRKIKIGPSWTKIPLDFLLFLKAFFELSRKSYDLIFSHEEAALLGVVLATLWQKSHVYDMHSSLPQQLENFEFSKSPILRSIFQTMERYILKKSQAVVVICQDLMEKVKDLNFEAKAVLLENFLDFSGENIPAGEIAEKRRELAPRGEKIVLYTGNFQPYQGIPLLLEAAARMGRGVIYLLVGGSPDEQEEMRKRAKELNIREKVVFVDKVPPSRVALYTSLADVLVSPRISGTNTPLKIYSFLKSGKPLVATNLWTHTQVLSAKNAVLVEATASDLAKGISFALWNEEARARAKVAKEWADREFTPGKYREKIERVLRTADQNFRLKLRKPV